MTTAHRKQGPAPQACVDALTTVVSRTLRVSKATESVVPVGEQVVASFNGEIGVHRLRPFRTGKKWQLRWKSAGSFHLYGIDETGKLISTIVDHQASASGHGAVGRGYDGIQYLEVNAGSPWWLEAIEYVRTNNYTYDVSAEITLGNPFPYAIDLDLLLHDGQSRAFHIPGNGSAALVFGETLGEYEQKRSSAALLSELGSIRISKVVNTSEEAVAGRARIAREAANRGSRGDSKLAHDRVVATTDTQAAGQEAGLVRTDRSPDTSDADHGSHLRKAQHAYMISGVTTLVVGGGSAAALLVAGAVSRGTPQKIVDELKAKKTLSKIQRVELGSANKDLSRAKAMVAAGAVTTAVAVTASTVLFIIANKRGDEAARMVWSPWGARSSAGLTVLGRF